MPKLDNCPTTKVRTDIIKDSDIHKYPGVAKNCHTFVTEDGYGNDSIIYNLQNPDAVATLRNGIIHGYKLNTSGVGTPATISGKPMHYEDFYIKIVMSNPSGDVHETSTGSGNWELGKSGSHVVQSKATFNYIKTDASGSADLGPAEVDLHLHLDNINAGWFGSNNYYGEQIRYEILGGTITSGGLTKQPPIVPKSDQLLHHTQGQSTLTGSNVFIDSSGSFSSDTSTAGNPNVIYDGYGKGHGVTVTYTRTGQGDSQFVQFIDINFVTSLKPQKIQAQKCTEWEIDIYEQKININEKVAECASCSYKEYNNLNSVKREFYKESNGTQHIYTDWQLKSVHLDRFKDTILFMKDIEEVSGTEEFPFIYEKQVRRDCGNIDIYMYVCSDCHDCEGCGSNKKKSDRGKCGDKVLHKELVRAKKFDSCGNPIQKWDSCGNDITPKDCWKTSMLNKFNTEFCGTKAVDCKKCWKCLETMKKKLSRVKFKDVHINITTTKTYPIPYPHKHDELDYLSGLFNTETGLNSTSSDAHEITAPYTTQAPSITTSHEYVIPYAQKDDATNYLINEFNTATGLTATASDVTIITAPSSTTGASQTTPGDTLKLASGTPNSSAEILKEVQKQRPNAVLADIDLTSYTSTPLNIPSSNAPTGTPGSPDTVVASVDLTKTGSNIKTISGSASFDGLGYHDSTSMEYISNGAITQVDSHTVRFEGLMKFSLVKPINSAVISGTTLTAPAGWEIKTHVESDGSLIYYLFKRITVKAVRLWVTTGGSITGSWVPNTPHEVFKTQISGSGVNTVKTYTAVFSDGSNGEELESNHFNLRDFKTYHQPNGLNIPTTSWGEGWVAPAGYVNENNKSVSTYEYPTGDVTGKSAWTQQFDSLPASYTPTTQNISLSDVTIKLNDIVHPGGTVETDGRGRVSVVTPGAITEHDGSGSVTLTINKNITYFESIRAIDLVSCNGTVVRKWGDDSLVKIINDTKTKIDQKQNKTDGLVYLSTVPLSLVQKVI